MSGGFRQAMTPLHTWGGLVFGWVLAVIFIAGTISVFAAPVTEWMMGRPAAVADARSSLRAVDHAVDYLQRHAPDAREWNIYLPDDWLGWHGAADEHHEAHFDPVNGGARAVVAERETAGGHHFVELHYALHGGFAGIMVVGFVTMVMLVALVSGVIIHRRIFKDFFTLRLGKGQRSWLDGHNVASVLTLPFQLMIAYTGLAIFHYAWMPASIAAHYGLPGGLQGQFNHVGPYFDARREQSLAKAPPPSADMPFSAVPALAREASERSGLPVEWIAREKDSDGAFRVWIGMAHQNDKVGLPEQGAPLFQGYGDPVQLREEQRDAAGAGEMTLEVMTSLHFGSFGSWTARWVWFLSGIAGCVMIATGLVLFTAKRRERALNEFGAATPAVYRVIESLNVAAVAGATLASIACFWANRLLPLDLPSRAEAEVRAFFLVWLLALLHAMARPRKAWREQLGLAAALCVGLPLLNVVTTGDWFGAQAARGAWRMFGVEAASLAIGLALALVALMPGRKRA